MFRGRFLLVLLCVLPAAAGTAAPAGCPIETAAAQARNVWMLCGQNRLYLSSDAGATWKARPTPEGANLRAVAVLDSRRGVVAGNGGALFVTADAAESWRRIPLPVTDNLTSLAFIGEEGWAAGWSGVILHTGDGGLSWRRQETGLQQGLENIYFFDRRHGWAVGWVGTILRTADGGAHWEKVRMSKTLWSLHSIAFRDPKEGWAVGFGGLILRTRDGGVTWEELPAPTPAWLTSVYFDRQGQGWIAADQKVLRTDDDGVTWKEVAVEDDVFPHSVLAVQGAVWIVGDFGVLAQPRPGLALAPLASWPASA